jgi:hypothetical protein
MPSYIVRARTNYFRVKDLDALKLDLQKYGINPANWDEDPRGVEFVIDDSVGNNPYGSIALFGFDGWPSLDEDATACRLGLDDGDHDDVPVPAEHADLVSLVATHLVDHDLAVFMEVGFEKMRELNGIAVAVNASGETRTINLNSIYDAAKELVPADATISLVSW